MHEYAVRLRFTKHCLGHIRRSARVRGSRQQHFLLPRDLEGHVVFLPTWWQAVLLQAASVLCRYQRDSRNIRFALPVEGQPRPLPQGLYARRTAARKVVLHEAFWPGDEIVCHCAVPAEIDADGLRELLETAGKYFGISPACGGQFGFFSVVSVQRLGV